MAKRLVIVWLFVLSIALFSTISVCYGEEIQGHFFIKNVVINGEKIVNYNLQYPVVLVDDVMYLPMTKQMCEIYGIEAKMDWESRTLKITKTESTRKNISDNSMKNDGKPQSMGLIADAKVVAYEKEVSFYIYDTLEKVELPEMMMGEIDLKGQPLLERDNVIYIPLRALVDDEYIDWDIHFSNYYGLCVSTEEDVPAEKYFDQKEALANKGLVQYIMRINNTIGPSYGQQLVFCFKRAGELYGVDPLLVMAVARTESRFNTGALGRGGAAGMMQVMPKTGERYGLTVEQLMDPKIAIDFGAMYISERIAAYEGDWLLALSAYNQGSTRVNRGTHSYTYANRVMGNYEAISEYLLTNGFVLR